MSELAEQLSVRPERISSRIQTLLHLGLFEVKRQSGRRSAYRPVLGPESRSPTKLIKPRSTTVDEVVAGLFNGSRVLADAFRRDVLGRARQLDLRDATEVALAEALGAMYQEIRRAREGRTASDLLGPLDLLERYLDWLGEQDWIRNATVRALRFDSDNFNQFRREESRYQVHDRDPVTGR
ncbi:MAG TPA: hypothetical protein VN808_09155 [Stellaceae bacterium]|nr:hypothetical protein [Stellaceae bacterium]